MIRTQRNVLNPSMGRVSCLTARWSCSTILLRYLLCDTDFANDIENSLLSRYIFIQLRPEAAQISVSLVTGNLIFGLLRLAGHRRAIK